MCGAERDKPEVSTISDLLFHPADIVGKAEKDGMADPVPDLPDGTFVIPGAENIMIRGTVASGKIAVTDVKRN